MKPRVICQPQSKFDMLTFVVLHTMWSILFFSGTQKGDSSQRGGPN